MTAIALASCAGLSKKPNDVLPPLPTLELSTPENLQKKSKHDTYASYAEMAKARKEGVDYSIQVIDREHPVLVMALHGGEIEKSTDILAEQIADGDFSLYIFKGILPNEPGPYEKNKLHVTSLNYDEPRALQLAQDSRYCLSLHGFTDKVKGRKRLCVGGGHIELKTQMATALEKSFPEYVIDLECKGFKAETADNIVNKCQRYGVQFEFSEDMRHDLMAAPAKQVLFKQIVRDVLLKAR